MLIRAFSFFLFLLVLGVGVAASAASINQVPPEVIEQIRNMPPAQARALAQQYGIDASVLDSQAGSLDPVPGQVGEVPNSLEPASEFLDPRFRFDRSQDVREQEKDASASQVIEPLDPAERFGLGFFSAEVSTFAPLDNSPVPQDYRLGAGDELKLLLLGQDNDELTLVIDRSGAVAVPELGLITVAGMTFEAASELLRQRIAAERIGVKALVGIGRLRAINVMLAGEVRIPGARSLSSLSRVTHALFASGGLSSVGSLRNIQVKRGGETVGRFDAYDLLLNGDSRGDIPLRDGDVVFVPPLARLAGVSGAVRRPGVFELADEETLGQLLAMAAGPTARGRGQNFLLERERPDGGPEIIQLSASELQSVVAESGDRLRIQVASQRFSNRVTLKGALQRPGVFGHFEGLRLSNFLEDPDVDTLENTDLAYGLVISTNSFDGSITVRQFAPAAVFAGDESNDLLLSPRDEVLIFSRPGAGDAFRATSEAKARTKSNRNGNMTSAEGADPDADDEFDIESRAEAQAIAEAEISSRSVLLAPVLAQLDRQARPDSPVSTVTIEGAAQVPGRYPLGEGYTVADLIAAAGGLRGDAYGRSIEVQRVVLSRDGVAEVRTLTVDSADVSLKQLPLVSRDRVSVRAIPNWQPNETVILEGQFRFPGEYALLPGETLGALIDRVGGVSVDAFPYGAVYTAEVAAATERAETERFANDIRRSYASMSLTQQQQQATFQELEQAIQSILERKALGRIAIDLPRILAGDEGADVVLSNGDRIFLPRRNDTVTVLGEVFRPGSFRFEAGQSLDDYLALGAGLTVRADKNGLYIVRANGRVDRPERSLVRFGLADASVRPGDTVVVPVNASYREPLDFWTSITQVAYQSGIGIASLLAAIRN